MKTKLTVQKIFSILCALILLIGCCSVLLACQPKHTCQNVCQNCGKCLNADCTEEACVDKCLGHIVCESKCLVCGGCNLVNCRHESIVCTCGYPWYWTHVCANVCVICGYCTNSECDQEPCTLAQCPGHDSSTELILANEPVTEYIYVEPTSQEKDMLLQAFCDDVNSAADNDWCTLDQTELVEYYGKIGDKYFYCPRVGGNMGLVIEYFLGGIYLVGNVTDLIYVYVDGVAMEIDDAYANEFLTKDEVVVLSHYLIAYRYRAECQKNGIEINEPIKVNVIAHLSETATLYFIGEKPTATSSKTPRMLKTLNLDYKKVDTQCGIMECKLLVYGQGTYGSISEELQQKHYFMYTFDVRLINEYFNLYLDNIK